MDAVPDAQELRERLRSPLRRELRAGCRDDVVVGGLERLIRTVGTPFAEVRTLLAGYAEMAPEMRQERVRQALGSLDRSAAANPGPHASPGPPDKGDGPRSGAAEKGGGPGATRLLEARLHEVDIGLAAQAGRKLAELGVATHRDLLRVFPRRYEDRRALPDFAGLAGREQATVIGTLLGRKATKSRRGMTVLRAFMEDRHGGRLSVVWFNQPWLETQLFPGRTLIATGRVKAQGGRTELHATHHEVVEGDDTLATDRIVGIYATPRGLAQDYLRRAIRTLLDVLPTVPDHLPRPVLAREDLVSLKTALEQIHFPDDEAGLAAALRRLKFDEFLFLELRMLRAKAAGGPGAATPVDDADVRRFEEALPFRFTGAQRRALDEILADVAAPRQMARMLQGDVGSGKTALAAAAAWVVVRAGRQAAVMAPTEILARQHFLNLREYLHPLGVRTEMLSGSQATAVRREARARVSSGGADLVVGTHALIQEGVEFRDLGLAVIDEEHRFGVEQRRALIRTLPDVLVMSATPIPRSLALTLYGDLDLSVLDELPPGRTPVRTTLVGAPRRREVYREVWDEIQRGRQAFVVAPLVERSEAETMQEIASATEMADDLRRILPEACRIELLHGRMPGAEKDAVMARFHAHEIDLLVSTTVVEVGVDVPNASVMVIENAERFGLSQLHQLRGRVGRGAAESRCILVAGDRSRKTQRRLEVVARHTDGFLISEKDLELRGPGELRGTRQSGLPDLQLGDVVHDGEVIERARAVAERMLEADPRLEARWATRLRDELKRRVRAVGLREPI
ncbi:MAG: ATP-dependent DNA helicase RecG [Trueperaceae bacterium]|nr:ATP-dependent DNA helicase RecG [Trueperaceae bacterium]